MKINFKFKIKYYVYYFIGLFGLLLLSYFFLNHSLSQLIYYVFYFAKEVKSHQAYFVIHRVIFIPIALLIFSLYFKQKLRNKLIVVLMASLFSLFYIFSFIPRIGRIMSYLYNPEFYLITIVFILPLRQYHFIINKNYKLNEMINIAIFVESIYLAHSSSKYGIGIVVASFILKNYKQIYISDNFVIYSR